MKKALFLFICIFLVGTLSVTNSCKKADKIKGCTDKDSRTYDPAAQQDDGSCLFDGSVVFWYDQGVSQGLISDGATSLIFTINGDIIGSTVTSIYWITAPGCGQTGSITLNQDLGNVKTHAYTLVVKDQTGFEYWNTLVNVDANTCTQFQLLLKKKK